LIADCGFRIADFGISVTEYGIRNTDYGIRTTDWQLLMNELDQELHETIAHLYDNAPGFHKRLQAAGLTPDDLPGVADLARLPVFRKDDLIALQQENPPFGGLLAVPVAALRRVFQSPGPINEPDPRVHDLGRWGDSLKAAGFRPGDVVLNAFGYHLTPAGISFDDSLHSISCVVIPGGIGNQEQQIQAMAAFGAVGYVGLPSYLKALLDKAAELGIALKVSKAFVLAEPLPPSLRQELNQRGVAVYQGYGTAECGNLGYDVDGYAGWRIPDNTIVQICDINSGQPLPHGETGEVVVTLLNRHYAIVRFGVGDLSAIIPESATDGGGLRLKGWQYLLQRTLDRHVENGRADQAALIYDSPVTDQKKKIYLRRPARRGRHARRRAARQGVAKGDRVIVYMPMVPEAVIGDARLRAHRRGPFRGVRRLRRQRAGDAHRRRQAEADPLRLLRHRAGPCRRLQAAARRGDRPGEAQARPA
jgi:phenylacetate-CoA ligase